MIVFNPQDFSYLQSGGAVSLAVVVPKLSVAGRDLLQVGRSLSLLFDSLNL